MGRILRKLAHTVKLKSKDENTQIGAVIVGKDKEIVSTGYNSFPRGLQDNIRVAQERPEKYFWFEHAERNAIYNFARIGVSTKGCTMYLSVEYLVQIVLEELLMLVLDEYFVNEELLLKGPHWEENYERSWSMLEEAGINVQFYDDEYGGL